MKAITNAQATNKLPSFWTIPTDIEIEPLALVHVMLQFILCISGLGISMIVLGIEIFHHKIKVGMSTNGGTNFLRQVERTTRNRDRLIMSLVEL